MGVFPRTQRPTDGRFCSAWTGSILKPRLWIMVSAGAAEGQAILRVSPEAGTKRGRWRQLRS